MTLRAVAPVISDVADAHASLTLSMVVALVFARRVLAQPPSPSTKAGALSSHTDPIFGAVFRAQASIAVGSAPPGQTLHRVVAIVKQDTMHDGAHSTIFAGPTRVTRAGAFLSTCAVASALVRAGSDTTAVASPPTATVALACLQIAGAVAGALSGSALPAWAVVNAAPFSSEHVVTPASTVQTRSMASTPGRARSPVAVEAQARTPYRVACADAVGPIAGAMARAHARASLLLARVAPPAFQALALALMRVARAVARALVLIVW